MRMPRQARQAIMNWYISRIYPGYNGVAKSMSHDYYLNIEAIEKSSAIMIARN